MFFWSMYCTSPVNHALYVHSWNALEVHTCILYNTIELTMLKNTTCLLIMYVKYYIHRVSILDDVMCKPTISILTTRSQSPGSYYYPYLIISS